VREFIQDLRRQGRTIILCTHNLDEAERLSDRIVVLKTTVVAVDTPEALRRKLFGRSVVLRLRRYDAEFLETIESLSFVKSVEQENHRWIIRLEDPDANCPELVRRLVEAGADVQSLLEDEQSLADVYLKLVEEQSPGATN